MTNKYCFKIYVLHLKQVFLRLLWCFLKKNYDYFNLQVKLEELRHALTTRTIFTRGESVVTNMATNASMDVRDAFVKGIYGRMFIWMVDKINEAIFKPKESPSNIRTSIGVLDIFGFENFGTNRFVEFE